ncbi:MAG: serine hydrolase [Dehalococcoidales bacterium]|nr:serine hydrolase [Dehalococcoidales bacterium]
MKNSLRIINVVIVLATLLLASSCSHPTTTTTTTTGKTATTETTAATTTTTTTTLAETTTTTTTTTTTATTAATTATTATTTTTTATPITTTAAGEPPIPRDYWPTEDWQTSTPEAQGMDSAKLQQLMDVIKSGNHGIDSVLVIRHGYLVWEEYAENSIYDRDTPHIIYSATKSFTSALIGIAIDRGYIQGVDQKVVSFFTDRTIANMDERKRRMAIEDLLTMTSGFQWNEISYSYADSRNSLYQAMVSGNYVQYVLDCPMAFEPGVIFNYNTGNTQVLSAIISKATGVSADVFAGEHLFKPIGITSARWDKDAQGIASGGSYLYMTPRDMAKFGYLFLNNGVWDGKQIISSGWVNKSTFNIKNNYGYLWWVNSSFGYYSASGALGQRIFVAPDADIVCVFTTSREEGTFVDQSFRTYVLGSVTNQ